MKRRRTRTQTDTVPGDHDEMIIYEITTRLDLCPSDQVPSGVSIEPVLCGAGSMLGIGAQLGAVRVS